MKKILFLLFIVSLIITACGDDTTSDEQLNEEIGTYSGVLVGSSGYFNLDLKEKGSSITIVFDGTTTELTTDKVLEKGKKIDLIFTNGTISASFSVDANGDNTSLNVTIPNHNVVATISKGSKDNPVILYTGEYYEQISKDNGATYRRTGKSETSNLSVQGDKFTLLSTPVNCDCDDDGKVFTEKGIIVSKDDKQVTIKTTHQNDGPGTLLRKLDSQDIEESESTFTIDKEGNLTLVESKQAVSPDGTVQPIYTYEYHYKLVK